MSLSPPPLCHFAHLNAYLTRNLPGLVPCLVFASPVSAALGFAYPPPRSPLVAPPPLAVTRNKLRLESITASSRSCFSHDN